MGEGGGDGWCQVGASEVPVHEDKRARGPRNPRPRLQRQQKYGLWAASKVLGWSTIACFATMLERPPYVPFCCCAVVFLGLFASCCAVEGTTGGKATKKTSARPRLFFYCAVVLGRVRPRRVLLSCAVVLGHVRPTGRRTFCCAVVGSGLTHAPTPPSGTRRF